VRPEEGASARSIGALGATSSRTIFEDIFGQSAFIDVHAPAQASRSVVPSDETSGDYTGFFDARAYLMPPLESMFDALMDTFLKPRSVEQVKPEDAIEEAREDEDMEMEVDEKAETETFSDPRHRVVDDRELDQFVELFRRHAVEGLPLLS
jgi:NET1-associated nuclear protein 1 (U3 small nucleolar RNA-associated protein 17)